MLNKMRIVGKFWSHLERIHRRWKESNKVGNSPKNSYQFLRHCSNFIAFFPTSGGLVPTAMNSFQLSQFLSNCVGLYATFSNILKDIDDEVADLLKVTARLLDTKVAEMLTNVEEASLIIKLIKFISILSSQILKNFPHVIDGASFSILTGDYQ